MALTNLSLYTVKTRIEKGNLKPYDGNYPLDLFFKALSDHPELKESLYSQLESNHNWVAKADRNQIFFILNNSAWKRPKNFSFEPNLRLSFVGSEKAPTISIDL